LAARDRLIAAAATEHSLPLWLLRAAKRKPVLAGERRLDDRSWVIAEAVPDTRRRANAEPGARCHAASDALLSYLADSA
jgi:hypothetical protein